MLYLAEVIQKKGGIIGGTKSELKLLACQRSEQHWSAIATEETIPTDEANRFSPGTLLLVDLTANKQVQRIQEAGRPLVNILQNFTRLQERFKTQEEEIEQWKQSLTYQSQELNRREMEMEARLEQLQAMETESEQLEMQRQAFEATRQAVMQQQEELNRQRQELEGAWEQLQGQKQQLEERQTELVDACVLDETKAQALYHLLDRFESGSCADAVQSALRQAHEVVHAQQNTLNDHWQILEQQSAQQMQHEIDQQVQRLDEQWQSWKHAQDALEQAKSELKAQQLMLQTKQDYAQVLQGQIQQFDLLRQQIHRISEGSESTAQVDVQALEKMSIDDLRSRVQSLQRDFDQSSQFVHGQEEELELKQQEIHDLEAKIAQVNEFDRMSLEAELTDERDAYQFLEDTLVGQRRSLTEKEGILNQYKGVLARRQGKRDPNAPTGFDFGAIFAQFDNQRQQQSEALQIVESEIEQLKNAIEQAQETLNQQSSEQSTKRDELEQLEAALRSQQASAAEQCGKLSLYQELMQPLQDGVTAMQQQLEAIAQVAQNQDARNEQQQAIEEMRQFIHELTQKPEFALT